MINTPNANRFTFVLVGRCNVGKSSLMNQLTGQNSSIVSDKSGTTTDPVSKASELAGLGAVLFIDTAGLDDTSDLATLRLQKTMEALKKADAIFLCVKASQDDFSFETNFLQSLNVLAKPIFIVATHSDLILDNSTDNSKKELPFNLPIFYTSYSNSPNGNQSVVNFKSEIIKLLDKKTSPLFAHKLKPNSLVLLIMPQDIQAPKNRLILPQVMVLRELLDFNHTAICSTFTSLENSLQNLAKKPDLVITDSQLFNKIKPYFTDEQQITSFSVILASGKGDVNYYSQSLNVINDLKDGDEILILEACSHHALQNDIGRVQIPNKLLEVSGKKLKFTHHSGADLPDVDMKKFKMIIQCGSCMINQNQSQNRLAQLKELSIPTTNYGIILAHFSNQLTKATQIFQD